MAILFHQSKVHLVSIGLKRSILVAAVIIYLLTLQIFNLIITLTKDGGMASPFVAFTLDAVLSSSSTELSARRKLLL